MSTQNNSTLTDADSDPLFEELVKIEGSLAKTNKPLVSALIKIFGNFKTVLISDFEDRINFAVASIKSECLGACQAKDAKIAHLESTNISLRNEITSFQSKVDAIEAYARRDTVIISGAVGPPTPTENTRDMAVNLIKSKLGADIDIQPRDISVAHRLQVKKPSASGNTPPPNIYVKLVLRDLKKELIVASKNQNKEAQNKIFINEGLTAQRSAVFRTLIKIKKSYVNNPIVKGVTSIEGDFFAFTSPQAEAAQRSDETGSGRRPRDIRHKINTREQLQKFCSEYVAKPLEEFITIGLECEILCRPCSLSCSFFVLIFFYLIHFIMCISLLRLIFFGVNFTYG